MRVMRRYCDYDYDNNCIILFDADDEVDGNDPFESKFNWISSGDDKDKKYHAAILNEQQREKEKKTKKEQEQKKKAKEVKAALREYLKNKYQETKTNVKTQQKLLDIKSAQKPALINKSAQKVSNHKSAHKQQNKQQIASMAAYKAMQPVSYYNNNQIPKIATTSGQQYVKYLPRRQSITGLPGLHQLRQSHVAAQTTTTAPRSLSLQSLHSRQSRVPSPRYQHPQNINNNINHPQKPYLSNNNHNANHNMMNKMNPNYAVMNVLMIPKVPQYIHHQNKFNCNYGGNAMQMRPCIQH